jgi:TonB family protein
VQQPALFELGIDSLLSFIYSSIELPKPIEPEGLNEKIFIRFIVTSLGEVKNPMIIRSSGSNLLDSAVVDVVRKFPSFLPAKHRGKIVNSYTSISVLVRPLLGH